MDISDLERMVEERQKEASEKDFVGRTKVIMRELDNKKRYKRGDLVLRTDRDRDRPYFTIHYKGELVLKKRGEIESYHPGPWEETFDSLYQEAVTKLSGKWGIDGSPIKEQ